MFLKLTTPPEIDCAEPPVVDALQQAVITHHDDDSLVKRNVYAAMELVTAHTSRQLLTATWTLYADRFASEMQLRVCPVQSVVSVKYVDAAGALQTVAPSAYQLDAVSEPARLVPAHGYDWPNTREEMNAVRVEFLAGYDDWYSVPERAKQAVMLLAAHWYENREAVLVGTISKEIELAYDTLVSSLKWSAV